ncbi:Ni/Fe hydrogenase subunit alpha [Geobacter sp. DSM 9736]|uniref:Ni/Fe hydrogenase subunit alpha n=1 Tax=Geobacter sp. DSM 9736 TaxID=1277350 RepID=UPI000B507DD4|nr:Ni/Fe hydrogenase subunit alpha [Geobacter sp. DSM 9736]SNB46026.1 Coenzyme F420-reducing hydrogenase, alpha subunit [Geobacter sp. DSM 9736]
MSDVIEIKPLTRVEGHGRIKVRMAGKRVEDIELSLYESPRLFEALLLGKTFTDIPEIICRICSLCSTVHRITALQAVERALDIPVSEQVRLYRELILNGGHIQSHALHLFCLILPDYLGVEGFPELAREAPELFRSGLRIKEAGNLVQEVVGGRLIHPVTLIVGGMGKPAGRDGLLRLKEALESVLPEVKEALSHFSSSPSAMVPTPLPAANFLALEQEFFPLFGNNFRTAHHRYPVAEYRHLIAEDCMGAGNAKMSLFAGKPPTVGAVARLNLEFALTDSAVAALMESGDDKMMQDIRGNTFSQAIELIHAVERSISLIDTLLAAGFPREEALPPSPRGGAGTAAVEAPRGTLIHSYAFDSSGRCTFADIITPTALNQSAMKRDLWAVARALEGSDEPELKLQLEMLVRAYDPCISCSVHVVRL